MDLDNNELSGSIPPELASLINLDFLNLGSNRLTGPIPPGLGRLSRLVELFLNDNQLTGPIPAELGRLSSLETLVLSFNELSGEIPASLSSLSSLEWLLIRENQFVGCIPESLRDVEYHDLRSLSLPFCFLSAVSLSSTPTRIPVRINSPIPVTTWFSEPVINFTVDDVTVTNGSADNFVGSDGDMVYTFDVIPDAIGNVTVDIFSGVAGDAEGTGYGNVPAHISLGIPYDDDHDGVIGREEVLAAVSDYFSGLITGKQILEVVRLYFFNAID